MSTQHDRYKEAGVDIEAGYAGVKKIKPLAQSTYTKGVLTELGSFGALFSPKEMGYKNPILVSGTDGVGTKLLLAIAMNRHDTIGIDCVAMCANDVLAQGASPLFFLDYIACGKNDPDLIASIVSGVVKGCKKARCALIGGETAEMPGVYDADHYDLAGFCVGAANEKDLVDGSKIHVGDHLIGLYSSGVHSNGYSLVRKTLEDTGTKLDEIPEGFDESIGETLLKPTKIYVKDVQKLWKNDIYPMGMAHITGGGFYENVPRMLPYLFGADIEMDIFRIPEVFKWLKVKNDMSYDEMAHIFNMGIGFVLCVSPEESQKVLAILNRKKEKACLLGKVSQSPGVHITWKE